MLISGPHTRPSELTYLGTGLRNLFFQSTVAKSMHKLELLTLHSAYTSPRDLVKNAGSDSAGLGSRQDSNKLPGDAAGHILDSKHLLHMTSH